DLFVTLSEHEGFCVPLVEAMYFGLPIIAYNSTAIPNTLNGAGVLIDDKNLNSICEIINLIENNSNFKNLLKKTALNKAKNFQIQNTSNILKNIFNNII
ncbi:glycosyltransferase, partial [Dolichospermum sp. ST_sed3]|nr:glycosyltransferase [Dolichospermum sp. ST_sed3]